MNEAFPKAWRPRGQKGYNIDRLPADGKRINPGVSRLTAASLLAGTP